MSETLVRTSAFDMAANSRELVRLYRKAPEVVAEGMRDLVGRWYGRHRKDSLAAMPSRLRRLARRSLEFSLRPKEAKKSGGNYSLDAISGVAYLKSKAARALELGDTIKPTAAKYLTVPVGRYRRMSTAKRKAELGFKKARNARGDRKLVLIKKKRRGLEGAILARQMQRTDARGRRALQAVFVLKRQVRIEPQLGVRATWDSLDGYRQRTTQEALDKIVERMARRRVA